jgi:cyclopropane-fatty-acyl-phospholipid synthase
MRTTLSSPWLASSKVRDTVEELLRECDIHIDGNGPCDIRVYNDAVFSRILADGSLGLGESYMEQWWDVRDLEELIFRLLKARLDQRVRTWPDFVAYCTAKMFNLQRPSRAFLIGQRHYDVGNDLYERMLDRRMIYSCGYWESAETLEDAQRAKLELVFRKLALQPGQRVLDVGCGWGGALQLAAEEYQVEGVGITVSREQAEYARRHCKGLPITIRLQDYRDVRDKFSHIYSIGMFEHVGPKNYRTYMQTMRRCLQRNGRFLLHTIGANRPSPSNDPWIEKYIFPNSKLPTRDQIAKAIGGLFNVVAWQSIGPNYVRTLHEWRRNFDRYWPALKVTRDERFHRMWLFYLSASAATFRAGNNDVWQVLLAPVGASPVSRPMR